MDMDTRSHHLPIELYSASKQHKNSHHHSNVDSFTDDGYYRRNNRSIYGDSTGRLYKKCCERNPHITPPSTNPSPMKWSRNNIALTMEYFEPISSTSTPKRYSNQSDYSYAYYEPGAAMRHSNIPKTPTTDDHNYRPSTTTSIRSSPKSIRSLLSKPNGDQSKPNNRHTYTTRYGTQENIYEDVSSIRMHTDGFESSNQTLNGRAKSGSKIEFQDILHSHYRVLEELNLSVEELLLSSTAKTNRLSPRKTSKRSTKYRAKGKSTDGSSKNGYAASMNDLIIGEDSGFSGSSSGVSYIGSLRNYKTALTRSHRNSAEINNLNNVSECSGTLQRATNDSIDSRKVLLQMTNQSRGDKCSGTLKGLKFPFWKK